MRAMSSDQGLDLCRGRKATTPVPRSVKDGGGLAAPSHPLSSEPTFGDTLCQDELLQSEVVALSCIQEEEDEESPGPSLAPKRLAGSRGPSSSYSVHAGGSLADFVEPLDENLNRLQRKVASMLEMQRRSNNSSSQEDLRSRSVHSAHPGPEPHRDCKPVQREASDQHLQHSARAASREPQASLAAHAPETHARQPKECCPSLQTHATRRTPETAAQYRELLAEHYKQQLYMLDEEEAELQHQMRLRQQLRLELHEEHERCEQAARNAEAEAVPQTDQAHRMEEKQLELLRSLEEQLRISEERRLELERENRVLQSRIHKTQAAPAAPAPRPRAALPFRTDQQDRPSSRSPRRPAENSYEAAFRRTASPPPVQDKAVQQARCPE